MIISLQVRDEMRETSFSPSPFIDNGSGTARFWIPQTKVEAPPSTTGLVTSGFPME